MRIGYRRSLVLSTSGLVLFAFQPEAIRAEWKARLAADVSKAAWKDFETRAEQARARGFVRMPSDVTKGIVDLSAPIMQMGRVGVALTCPHVDTRNALSLEETALAVRATARELSEILSGTPDRSAAAQ